MQVLMQTDLNSDNQHPVIQMRTKRMRTKRMKKRMRKRMRTKRMKMRMTVTKMD
jgi:hypothetical protein